jgi:hypothetical protein
MLVCGLLSLPFAMKPVTPDSHQEALPAGQILKKGHSNSVTAGNSGKGGRSEKKVVQIDYKITIKQ